MSTPSKPPGTTKSSPAYISSGQTLDSLPLTVRLNRAADGIYNFLGLYLVSLLSLDPYTAAQNSRFNTRGPGRSAGTGTGPGSTAGAGSGVRPGSTRLGGGGGGGASSGPRGGGFGGGGAGRRMGTVDDVRGPECGSCG